MAFQPIVDVVNRSVYAYEALVRGLDREPAGQIMQSVGASHKYSFDQACRAKAITLALRLGLLQTGARLSINFLPGAEATPENSLDLTLRTANGLGFPLERLIFEVAEHEEVGNPDRLRKVGNEYRRQGLRMALDDFGAGFAGLNLLSDGVADIIKLDLHLIRNLERRPLARALIGSLAQTCQAFQIAVIAEGVETMDEYVQLRECGISLMQGYLFARPMFEGLPVCCFPALDWEMHLGQSCQPALPLTFGPDPQPVLQPRKGVRSQKPSRRVVKPEQAA